MEIALFINGHPTIDALEEYVFERLAEPETARLEEHILICEKCQTSLAEVDEYVFLMREAAAGYVLAGSEQPAGEAAPAARKAPKASRLATVRLGYAGGAAAMAVVLLAAFAAHRLAEKPETANVSLVALRDGMAPVNRAPAGRPLDLAIDTTGLAQANTYAIEIVDASGKPVWSGEVYGCYQTTPNCESLNGISQAHVGRGLKAGVYWVRLRANGGLLREFGLVAAN